MSFETIQTEITALRNDIKNLAKLVRKVKNTQEDPDGEKAKARAANNGFNRKQDVTPKLREFLGLPAEELISRSEVTKFITKYIAEQGLKHPRTVARLSSTASSANSSHPRRSCGYLP